ncbi:MAG: Inosine/uridine-preferring nucleoside hydrolase [Thermomicrobiales bacterium]|jgi:inosine-uridine nucleoside N-ribohydrolase|nr:Inosine/uridine-preferring nucleoside hydrolase [Thermomicrobiales bacterium]
MTEQVPVILDVDTGTDDALALGYAVASPRIELVAVTTVAGNVGVEKTTANTLAVLDWLGAGDVPVHRGASRPLVRPHRDAVYFHDEGGLGGAQLPPSIRSVGADRGPAALIRLARLRPREVTLVTLGPLTNLAIALNVEPNLPELLKSVVVMGGAYSVPGNTTPAAEFNILVDPEAAEQVFTARFPNLTTVGLDVTERVALTRDDWDAVNAASTIPPPATLLREVGKFAFSRLGREQFSLHDPLSVAVAIDPTLIDVRELAVAIDFVEPERGRTRIVGPGSVRVATSVDAQRALEEFRRTVGLPTARHGDMRIAVS